MNLKENHDEKKVEKSEIEQNICVLLFKMQKGSQMLDTVALWEEATKSQQQKAHPGEWWFYRGKMKGSL